MLKQENRYDFRKRMVSPHVPGKRDYSLLPDTDEFVLENGLYFVCAQDFSTVVAHAIEDFSKRFLTEDSLCPIDTLLTLWGTEKFNQMITELQILSTT